MPTDLIQLITFLGSTAGAGLAASYLFGWLRTTFPCPTVTLWKGLNAAQQFGYRVLWAPKLARYTVFAFSVSISLLFTGVGAVISGESAAPLLYACLSVWASQIVHASELSSTVKLKLDEPKGDPA